MRQLVRSICIGALLVFIANPAWAQVQVNAQVSNLRYSISDLNTADAIAPALRLEFGRPFLMGDVYGWHGSATDFNHYASRSESIDSDELTIDWSPMARSSMRYSGGASLADMQAEIDIMATPAIESQSVQARADAEPWELYFSLGPMTSMTFLADASLVLSAANLATVVQYGSAGASLVAGPTWWPGDYDSVVDSIDALVGTYYSPDHPLFANMTRTLSVTLANDSPSEWKVGHVVMSVGGIGNVTSLVPIPEASQYQMLIAGVALLLLVSRPSPGSARSRAFAARYDGVSSHHMFDLVD